MILLPFNRPISSRVRDVRASGTSVIFDMVLLIRQSRCTCAISASLDSNSTFVQRIKTIKPCKRSNQKMATNNSVQEPPDNLYTIREVAHRLRVNGTTVRRWINSGILPAVSLPHSGKRQSYRIRQSDIDRVLSTPVQERS